MIERYSTPGPSGATFTVTSAARRQDSPHLPEEFLRCQMVRHGVRMKRVQYDPVVTFARPFHEHPPVVHVDSECGVRFDTEKSAWPRRPRGGRVRPRPSLFPDGAEPYETGDRSASQPDHQHAFRFRERHSQRKVCRVRHTQRRRVCKRHRALFCAVAEPEIAGFDGLPKPRCDCKASRTT